MRVGQITNKYFKLGDIDYLQLDICGLNKEESLGKLLEFKKNNAKLDKVMLHGDWEKKGFSENNIKDRYIEYIEIIKELQKHIQILGITIHPPHRKKVDYEEFLFYCSQIKKYANIGIENRSNIKIHLSNPNEIIDFNKKENNPYNMTLDIPQLYISCKYNKELFFRTLKEINHENIIEYHLGNIKKTERNTFVARKLDEEVGLIDYKLVMKYLNKNAYFTLEILGGSNVFNQQKKYLNDLQ